MSIFVKKFLLFSIVRTRKEGMAYNTEGVNSFILTRHADMLYLKHKKGGLIV